MIEIPDIPRETRREIRIDKAVALLWIFGPVLAVSVALDVLGAVSGPW